MARTPLAELFDRRVTRAEDGCWTWNGVVNNSGYGILAVYAADGRRTTTTAHRVAVLLADGPIPAGLEVDHLCLNKVCVRRDHLEVVDRSTNVVRSKVANGYSLSTPRIQAGDGHHAHGSAVGYSTYRCRCQECASAWTVYCRNRKAARRAARKAAA